MDKKHLILLEITLIILLLISSSIIEYRINIFKRDCKITYNLNNSCPCKSPILYNQNPFINNLNNNT
jgi:hypothetical protein